MKSISCIAVILLLLLSSCEKKNRVYMPDTNCSYSDEGAIDTLNGTLLGVNIIAGIQGVEIVDSFLLIMQEDRQKIFTVYNTNSDSVVAEFGKIGKSASELSDAPSYCYFIEEDGDKCMCIQDAMAPITRVYDWGKTMEEKHLVHKKNVRHSFAAMCDCNFYYIGNEHCVLCQGLYCDNIGDGLLKPPFVALYEGNAEKSRLSYFGNLIGNDLSTSNLIHATTTDINPKKKKIVQIPYIFDQLSIVDYDNMTSLGVSNSECYDYEEMQEIVDSSADFADFVKKVIYYNKNVNVTDNYIVLLQDGKYTVAKCESAEPHETMVKIFDWNGNHIKTFCVREYLRHIAYDEMSNTLFGATLDGEIYKYKIDEKLN